MKATWNNQTIAEANKDKLVYIEGNWYFPPSSINFEFLRKSPTAYTCPWKGDAQYYDVGSEDNWSGDAAWSYPEPLPRAIDIVKTDFSGYVAFGSSVEVA